MHDGREGSCVWRRLFGKPFSGNSESGIVWLLFRLHPLLRASTRRRFRPLHNSGLFSRSEWPCEVFRRWAAAAPVACCDSPIPAARALHSFGRDSSAEIRRLAAALNACMSWRANPAVLPMVRADATEETPALSRR